MQTIYDVLSVPVPSDVMILNARGLPILIRDRMAEMMKMTMIALTGTS